VQLSPLLEPKRALDSVVDHDLLRPLVHPPSHQLGLQD
jgi:hypothetical protein